MEVPVIEQKGKCDGQDKNNMWHNPKGRGNNNMSLHNNWFFNETVRQDHNEIITGDLYCTSKVNASITSAHWQNWLHIYYIDFISNNYAFSEKKYTF